MSRASDERHARIVPTNELWSLLEANLNVLAQHCNYRSCPPERRERTKFALAAARELRRRGKQGTLMDSSELRASRNAILGFEA